MKNEIDMSSRQIANAIESLLDERNELQQRIDKAIEYLNNSWTGCYTDATLKYKVEEINITELLEILGGKE